MSEALDEQARPESEPGATWWRFRGEGGSNDTEIPQPPPWRAFTAEPAVNLAGTEPPGPGETDDNGRRLGRFAGSVSYLKRELDLINAAILLRRPMLITG